MARLLETIATVILLILLILLFSHMINGTTGSWLVSKFVAAPNGIEVNLK